MIEIKSEDENKELETPIKLPGDDPEEEDNYQYQGDLEFPRFLLHAFVEVEDQMDAGLATLSRIDEFTKKYALIHREFCTKVRALVKDEEHFFDSVEKSASVDKMQRCWDSWKLFVSILGRCSGYHEKMADSIDMVRKGILMPFEQTASGLIKVTKKKRKRMKKSLDNVQSDLDKKKAKCEKLIEQVKSPGSPETGKKFSFFSRKVKYMKILSSCLKYNETVEDANRFLRAYLTKDMPEVLARMQSIEEIRISSTRNHLEHFSNAVLQGYVELEGASRSLSAIARCFETGNDIADFVSSWYVLETCRIPDIHSLKSQPPSIFTPYSYDLTMSLENLSKLVIQMDPESKLQPESDVVVKWFGSSLEDVVTEQNDMNIEGTPADIPVVFSLAINAIYHTNGPQTEGIFRIAPDSIELEVAIKDLEQGFMKVLTEATNPHLATGVLKRFLMDLSDPLIPFAAYERCTQLGSSSSVDPEKLAEIFRSLPERNRKMLIVLFDLALEIAKPGNVEKSLMPLDNLAIMFGPSLLRFPHKTKDLAKVITAMRHECDFVRHMLRHHELLRNS